MRRGRETENHQRLLYFSVSAVRAESRLFREAWLEKRQIRGSPQETSEKGGAQRVYKIAEDRPSRSRRDNKVDVRPDENASENRADESRRT